MSSTLKLEVLNSAYKGRTFRFRPGILLGAASECQLRAQHPDLKHIHLRFVLTDTGRPGIEIGCDDAHVFLNGQDVETAEIRHNDLITAGPIRLRVVDEMFISQTTMRLDELLAEADREGDGEVLDFAKEDLFYLATKDPNLRKAVAFTIPSKDRFMDQAQAFLSRIIKASGADEEQCDAFMTVCKELILNAHRHGHKYDETKHILLRFRDDGKELSLTIEDQGPGFDHRAILAKVNDKDAASAARERYQAGGFGGLGYQLITRLSSRLAYNEAGNKVTFAVPKATPA